jgi:hypothetical protein
VQPPPPIEGRHRRHRAAEEGGVDGEHRRRRLAAAAIPRVVAVAVDPADVVLLPVVVVLLLRDQPPTELSENKREKGMQGQRATKNNVPSSPLLAEGGNLPEEEAVQSIQTNKQSKNPPVLHADALRAGQDAGGDGRNLKKKTKFI